MGGLQVAAALDDTDGTLNLGIFWRRVPDGRLIDTFLVHFYSESAGKKCRGAKATTCTNSTKQRRLSTGGGGGSLEPEEKSARGAKWRTSESSSHLRGHLFFFSAVPPFFSPACFSNHLVGTDTWAGGVMEKDRHTCELGLEGGAVSRGGTAQGGEASSVQQDRISGILHSLFTVVDVDVGEMEKGRVD